MAGPFYDTYAPPAIDFERGEGAVLYAADGARYLDFIAGIAVNALGHCHPKLVSALSDQAGKLWHLSNMFRNPGGEALAQAYCDATFADKVFFTNSGAEAVECALKTARRHHFVNGAPERIKIIGFAGSFHGRTYGAINAAANPNYIEGFGPAMAGFEQLDFADHDAIDRAIDETTAAVIVEPVQGEGGVRAIPESCLTSLRERTRERGALLIYDEVQSGAGRTGRLFAHEWAEDAAPDIMAVAKGVGGGFPMGACLATEDAARGMTVGTHGSTFGGNALAMAVGHAVMEELTSDGFLERVRDVSNHLRQGLEGLKDAHPGLVEEVRGKGLLLGLKLTAPNKAVRDFARDRGLLVGVAGENVLRLAPPLIIETSHVAEALSVLDAALTQAAKEPAA